MVKVIEDRDERILEAAIELAKKDGYQWITRERVAAQAGVSPGTINTAYGTMPALKRAVLSAAVDRGIWEIVAQGLADRHQIVMDAPPEIRSNAAAALAR